MHTNSGRFVGGTSKTFYSHFTIICSFTYFYIYHLHKKKSENESISRELSSLKRHLDTESSMYGRLRVYDIFYHSSLNGRFVFVP